MNNFKQRFEIIYKKYAERLAGTGVKPNVSAFARFLEIPTSTVKSWETRNVIPAAKDLKIIHDKLGFAYDWLISGEGEMFDKAAQKIEALEGRVRQLEMERLVEGTASQDSAANIEKAADGAA